MTPPKPIVQDERPIKCLATDDTGFVEVGTAGVTKIVPYLEAGGMGPVLAFAVYVGEIVRWRYNWLQCTAVAYYGDTDVIPAQVQG